MGDAVAFDGVDQRLRDRLLADEIAELLRPIAPREDGVLGVWRAGAWSTAAVFGAGFAFGHDALSQRVRHET